MKKTQRWKHGVAGGRKTKRRGATKVAGAGVVYVYIGYVTDVVGRIAEGDVGLCLGELGGEDAGAKQEAAEAQAEVRSFH